MARSRKVSDKVNNANFEQNVSLTPDERTELEGFGGLGYYSRTSLDDIINNFIVSHVGEGKVLPKVPRHEVAFWAQRGLQEFSYDVLQSEKNIEIELSPSLSLALPSDYVNYVKFTALDDFGVDRTLLPSRISTAKQGILQDSEFNYIYDNTGNRTLAGKSESTSRFQDDDALSSQADRFRQDSYGFLADDVYDYYYSGYYGRRYGLDPEQSNFNGTFQIDLTAGIVYFDGGFSEGDIVGLRYISDGLGNNGDLTNVYVPKLAEDALYASILYNITKLRPASAQLAPLYKKEASAKMRNAKLRLTNYKIEEIAQIMRGRAKWIKH